MHAWTRRFFHMTAGRHEDKSEALWTIVFGVLNDFHASGVWRYWGICPVCTIIWCDTSHHFFTATAPKWQSGAPRPLNHRAIFSFTHFWNNWVQTYLEHSKFVYIWARHTLELSRPCQTFDEFPNVLFTVQALSFRLHPSHCCQSPRCCCIFSCLCEHNLFRKT